MKYALVTGSNSGFGKLTTLQLLKEGFHVFACMRNTKNQTALMEEVIQLNKLDQLTVFELDVTNINQIEKVKESIEKSFGKLDVLVNNAGYCEGGFLEDIEIALWEKQQETNIFGTFKMTKMFLPLLEKGEKAKIINISSVSGFFGFPGMSAYTTSKFAIEGMSESLRLELLPKNISVSLIEPASYQTNIWEKGLSSIEITSNDPIYKQNLYKYATMAAKGGSNPIEVAKLVTKIATCDKPKFRYPIGKGAKSLSFFKRILPWGIIEKIVLSKLK